MSSLELRLRGLQGNPALTQLNHGIEREALRITPSGVLAQTSHPAAFGSPLTHPSITTDFSEAQLELITGVHQSVESCIRELADIHTFIHHQLEEELLWSASMPCGISDEDAIPIARYGHSNAARFKEIYREGLGHRYGRVMQTISGIHYNFSIPDSIWDVLAKIDGTSSNQAARNEGYLRLIRNFRKHSWLLIYLFGASPAVCASFLRNKEHNLQNLDASTCYLPFATSLRMGPLGYQSEEQSQHRVIYDSLADFIDSMVPVLTESHPPYSAIGVHSDGEYKQLTDAILQVEAELYATIRAKRKSHPGERALVALRRRGIEYVEVRCLDADPFEPVGINVDTAKFMDVFLLHSLLVPNEGESAAQTARNLDNQRDTVHNGRQSELELATPDGASKLISWAQDILKECTEIATLLDEASGERDRQLLVERQIEKVKDVSHTPSARLHRLMVERKQPFASLGLELAFEHHETMMQNSLSKQRQTHFEDLARQSVLDREAIEASDEMSFDAYLADYLSFGEDA